MMQRELNQQLWSARLQEQAASGLGIQAWCVREGLTASAFHYWRKRLVAPMRPATTLIALPSVGRQTEPVLEVMTPLGYVIRIASQEQLGWAKGLLEVLR
jgi:small-conductance mechanosensitive channel